MQVTYVALLDEIKRIYLLPRSMERFRDYLKTMTTADGGDVTLPPLVLINPMAREHLLELVDALIGLQADSIAETAITEALSELTDVSAELSASLVVLDDLKGGWTNRFAYELDLRRLPSPVDLNARQARRFWVTAVLWSSEPPSAEAVREAALTAVYRAAYVLRHGSARTLQQVLRQEGWVLWKAGSRLPPLAEDERPWVQEVLHDCKARDEVGTLIECLFGDEAAASLGYAGLGLPAWAGLRLALGEQRQRGGEGPESA